MTNTTTRTANHLAMGLNGSSTVHAAADSRNRGMHVLLCTGRTMHAAAWNGSKAEVTCKACAKAVEVVGVWNVA